MSGQQSTRRLGRLEAAGVMLAAMFVCLIAGRAAHNAGWADWSAVAALSHAYDVVHQEPRFNLALIGFAEPPLPVLLYLPFCALTPGWCVSGLACPVLGSLMIGMLAVLLNGLGYQVGAPWPVRWVLVGALVFHPLVLSLGALGSPGIVLAVTLLGGAWALMRWSREESFRDLLTCSLFFTAATLTRYESIWLALSATAYVGWRIYRSGEGWSRAEGTLIAFLLPLAYCAAVWVGANWAIMGEPWYFWRSLSRSAQPAMGPADWCTAVVWVMLLSCPLVFGLAYHEMRNSTGAGAVKGRAGACLLLGSAVGACVSPGMHAPLDGDVWVRLLTPALAATVVGWALLAVVVGASWTGPVDQRRPLAGTVLLSTAGLLCAVWLRYGAGVALPATPGAALRGHVAFAGQVRTTQATGRMLAEQLGLGEAAYVMGAPGFALSLYSGRPAQVHVVDTVAARPLPLKRGDLLAIYEERHGWRPAEPAAVQGLVPRGLAAVVTGSAGKESAGWTLYEMQRMPRTTSSRMRGAPRSRTSPLADRGTPARLPSGVPSR